MNSLEIKFASFVRELQEFALHKTTSRLISKIIRSLVKRLVRYGPLKKNGFTYSLYGVWLLDNWEDATFRFCVNGSYGFFYSDWLSGAEHDAFIDIGANLGLYTLIAAQNARMKKIYCFEPQPKIYETLIKNIEKNFADQVTALPYAISAHTEKSALQIKAGHSGAATLRSRSISEKKFLQKIEISTINHQFLDDTFNIPPDANIAVKIDTEGHEEQVLSELRKTRFWKQISNIYYEIDERYIDHERIMQTLISDGFTVTHKNGNSPHYDLMIERKFSL